MRIKIVQKTNKRHHPIQFSIQSNNIKYGNLKIIQMLTFLHLMIQEMIKQNFWICLNLRFYNSKIM